ncbi:MAG: AbrB family transcriptional regulator [Euryarchaeota archaeon]|nr:AbrB family transcriptional regulator [Euryarchaeota archaeon]
MPRGETTIVTKAATTSESLRTTIPMGIVRQFNIQTGDKIAWKIEPRDKKLVIVVEPEKE